MNKTNKLFIKYIQMFNEQVEGAPAEDAQTTETSQPEQPEAPGSKLSNNEKYIIKLLTNAFIFNPEVFDKSKQNYIESRIQSVSKMVNVPVSKIVDDIKSIVSMDRSLRVESKTNAFINNLYKLIEQVADGTEPQPDNTENLQLTNKEIPENSVNNENSVSLEEIFPLYKELMLKALKHSPTEEELMILKPVADQFSEIDPQKIVETIQNLLSQSLEDKEVEDNLSNA